ncbi:MAG TPA: response regulator [Pirellulales bacterium]|nr:response regulator [Pirellulales bacterium]
MRRRILLVDDEFPTRKILKFNLEQAGYEVFIANDGLEAWEALRRVPIDLLIIDEIMPRMTGSSVCEMVRDAGERPIPVVMITAKTPPFTGEVLESLGVAHCFAKPFSPRDLIAKVDELLSNASAAIGRF